MQVNTLLLTNILLLAVNIVTVFANIYLPRFTEQPRVEIVSLDALIDETEVILPNSVSSVVSTMLEILPDGDEFKANTKCFEALDTYSLVPASCIDSFERTAEIILRNAILERNDKIEALESITDFDEEELVSILTAPDSMGFVSTYYTNIFFNFLAVENIAKNELAADMRAALVRAAVGLVNQQYAFTPAFENALRLIEEHDSTESAKEIVFRVALLNSGQRPDLISPSAVGKIGDRNFNLSRVTEEDLSNLQQKSEAEFTVVPAGMAATFFCL